MHVNTLVCTLQKCNRLALLCRALAYQSHCNNECAGHPIQLHVILKPTMKLKPLVPSHSSFIIAFPDPVGAVSFALDLQEALMDQPWPDSLLALDSCKPIWMVPFSTTDQHSNQSSATHQQQIQLSDSNFLSARNTKALANKRAPASLAPPSFIRESSSISDARSSGTQQHRLQLDSNRRSDIAPPAYESSSSGTLSPISKQGATSPAHDPSKSHPTSLDHPPPPTHAALFPFPSDRQDTAVVSMQLSADPLLGIGSHPPDPPAPPAPAPLPPKTASERLFAAMKQTPQHFLRTLSRSSAELNTQPRTRPEAKHSSSKTSIQRTPSFTRHIQSMTPATCMSYGEWLAMRWHVVSELWPLPSAHSLLPSTIAHSPTSLSWSEELRTSAQLSSTRPNANIPGRNLRRRSALSPGSFISDRNLLPQFLQSPGPVSYAAVRAPSFSAGQVDLQERPSSVGRFLAGPTITEDTNARPAGALLAWRGLRVRVGMHTGIRLSTDLVYSEVGRHDACSSGLSGKGFREQT